MLFACFIHSLPDNTEDTNSLSDNCAIWLPIAGFLLVIHFIFSRASDNLTYDGSLKAATFHYLYHQKII
jgi:hypothetical protein